MANNSTDSSAVTGASQIRLAAQDHVTVRRGNNFYSTGVCLLMNIQLARLRRALAYAPRDIISLMPASVWLFDNYHLLYQQLKDIRPAITAYSTGRLPAVHKNGIRINIPRTAALADVMVDSSEGGLDQNLISKQLKLYQQTCVLQSAELWLLYPWLKMAVLRKLVSKAELIIKWIDIKSQADRLADDLDEIDALDTAELIKRLSTRKIYQDNKDETVWKAHMIYRLRRLNYLDENISEFIQTDSGLSREEVKDVSETAGDIVNQEEKAQAYLERDVSKLIISLKNLAMLDWSVVFEQSSCLEQMLLRDPAGIYGDMDSQSRDYYRKTVTKLARRCACTECQLAAQLQEFSANYAIERKQGKEFSGRESKLHNGIALMGYLHKEFSRFAGIRGSGSSHRTVLAIIYFTSVAVLSLLMMCCFILLIASVYSSLTALVITTITAILPLIGCAAGTVNIIFHKLVRPKPVMSMDYTEALPDNARTFIVMPVIFANENQVKKAAANLEKHFLANPQKNFSFAILGDLHDSDYQISSEDELILNRLQHEIEMLNRRYPVKPLRFYGFMRERIWNPSEHCWMGWERKRGKLEEFNRILRNEKITTWGGKMPAADFLQSFQFVITLDADTELVRDSAAHLAGIINHPLNRPELDTGRRRLKRGYAILQSSMKNKLAAKAESTFSRLFSNPAGIDPYASVTSDIYQDIFHEGIYVGKGIYSIDAMQLLLTGNLPENHILSHDLLESCYARCAFVSNIQLMDYCPSSFLSFMRREHRWIRGDWQILPWMFKRKLLNGLSKWKIFDNVRRSMTAPACLLLILLAAMFAPEAVWIALIPAIYLPILRLLQYVGGNLLRKLMHPFTHMAWHYFAVETVKICQQEIFYIIVMPYRAWNALDASFRALYRMLISHRHMLEWQTADAAEHKKNPGLVGYLLVMWPAVAAGIYLLLFSVPTAVNTWFKPGIISTITIGSVWILAPFISWQLSSSYKRKSSVVSLDSSDKRILDNISLDTWHYFAEQADESTGWLIPDNWQENPGPKRSEKTSPTNIGMQLLCTLSARDLGYSGLVSTIDSLERTLETIQKLPRFNGHFYNWYGLNNREVIMPDYISTVDSGNLLASFITLRQGLMELKHQQAWQMGNQHCLKILCQRCELTEQAVQLPVETPEEWSRLLRELLKQCKEQPETDNNGLKTDIGWLSFHIKEWLRDQTNGLVSSVGYKKGISELARSGNRQIQHILGRIDKMILLLNDLIAEMNFGWLYDHSRHLFRIGYRVSAGELDGGCYDLLASEARLASYLAVASGDVPADHWKKLGRPLTLVAGNPALVSWSGSLFEYLLPDLFFRNYDGSLLSMSSNAAVRQQLKHGRGEKIPWGVSESQYYRFDQDGNYQYKAFGVNKLRLQPSRYPARVIAPYATMLALMHNPVQAMINLRHLIRLGGCGRYGMYEAIDYTDVAKGYNKLDYSTARTDDDLLPKGKIVLSHMAHHQGMTLLSIDNVLMDNIMRRRFHEAPIVAASLSLLEETVSGPLIVTGGRHFTLSSFEQEVAEEPDALRRESPELLHRSYHVLAGNNYKVVMDSGGEGFSQYDDIQINRWQSVRGSNPQGQFIYLRDLSNGHVWSAAAEPISTDKSGASHALFGVDKVEFIRQEQQIMTNMEITVAPQEPYELRRLFISNQSRNERSIEITSYLEPVLTTAAADRAHPAFNRLFIETEYVADRALLICRRRNAGKEQEHFLGHQLLQPNIAAGVEFEIDRLGFVGRNNTLRKPDALYSERLHSCRQGFCPEPVMSLRVKIHLAPGASTAVVFMTAYGKKRSDLMRLSYEARQSSFAAGVFSRSLVHARLKLKYLGVSGKDYNQMISLASAVYDPCQAIRCPLELLKELKSGQQNLWRFGISGDYPLVVFHLDNSRDLMLFDQYLQLFEIFSQNRIEVDFVIICDEPAGYRHDLYYQVMAKTEHLKLTLQPKNHRSPFVLKSSEMDRQEYLLILCSACIYSGPISRNSPVRLPIIGSGKTETMNEKNHIGMISDSDDLLNDMDLSRDIDLDEYSEAAEDHFLAGEKIQQRKGKYGEQSFWNGIGYFADGGRSYEIRLEPGIHTPAPWSNIIANDSFGFLVTDKGSGFTWAENSQSGKLTPWSNDPVLDPAREVVLVRDDNSGKLTSPCRYHASAGGRYSISHRFGSSVFEHRGLELDQKMTVTVDHSQFVRYWHLKLHNLSRHRRRFTIVFYAELVLGTHQDETNRFLCLDYDKENEILTAVNHYQDTSRQHVAFAFCSEHISSWTTNRQVYLGHNRDPACPQELIASGQLGQRDGTGLAPCFALSVSLELHDNESRDLIFGLGSAGNTGDAAELAANCRSKRYSHMNLEKNTDYWQRKLSRITIESPDSSLNYMFNGWLLYQVISCRLRARAAFYQCGGAYGFRDQLQDSLALLMIDPHFVRSHLLRCATRQFKEGDVQHWWHENTNIGVRTRISDDLLWLPYVLCRYIDITNDYSVLDEQLHWLIGDQLKENEHDRAFVAETSEDTSSLFDHALAAIRYAATKGSHGLPLFGGGDWNDGIDLAGAAGQGESVWLSWFLITVLDSFSTLCRSIERKDLAVEMKQMADDYTEATEQFAWDGRWYLRGWFDNGQPMGSRKNLECRIDGISQSWAVISGRSSIERSRQALESADQYLVKDTEKMILLLTPPFDGLGPEPGYIRRYYPGVRENGGQYTHAAVWLAMACLKAGKFVQGAHLLSLINPINHTLHPSEARSFITEPYVLPADVYDGEPYTGHGGWSWYTGSASWFYQVILHDLLGLIESAGCLYIKPCLPDNLLPLTIKYKYQQSHYTINVRKRSSQHPKARGIWLDQQQIEGSKIVLASGPGWHNIIVYIE